MYTLAAELKRTVPPCSNSSARKVNKDPIEVFLFLARSSPTPRGSSSLRANFNYLALILTDAETKSTSGL